MNDHQENERSARLAGRARFDNLCAVCWTGLPTTGAEASHRVPRSALGWCPCNVLVLHAECHRMMHAHPEDARALGVHVSRHADPRTVPVHTPHGPVWLRCDTTHTHAHTHTVRLEIGADQ